MKQLILWGASYLLLLMCGCRPPEGEQQVQPAENPTPSFNHSTSPDIITVDPDFDRLSLADFEKFHADDGTWVEEGGMLICSGVPRGYLYSKASYRDFTFRGEYQFVLTEDQKKQQNKANTGFMVAIQSPHQVWPVSLEVQGSYGKMGSINTNGGLPRVKMTDLSDVRERVRLPVDQWNAVEIVMRAGKITSRLNGEIVCTSEATELKEGPIGLQAEGYVVRFRNLRIRRDTDGESSVPEDAAAPAK